MKSSHDEQVVSHPPRHPLPDPEMILTSSRKSLSRCGRAAASCKSTPAITPIARHLHRQSAPRPVIKGAAAPRPWSDLWSDHLVGQLSFSPLCQHYPGDRRGAVGADGLHGCGVGARWAVEGDRPGFIKLMNVWSYSGAARRAIWALEKGAGYNVKWGLKRCTLHPPAVPTWVTMEDAILTGWYRRNVRGYASETQ